MAPEQTFSTEDLRSHSIDYKRQHEHKHKWALGERRGATEGSHPRPWRTGQVMINAIRRDNGKQLAAAEHQAKMARKHDILSEVYASGDSSADEEVEEASAAPAPDAEITYSFDAKRGPSGGSQVLSVALAKAVERFENHATDKLVKEEYEVLHSGDEEDVGRSTSKQAKRGAAVEEDDYEFV